LETNICPKHFYPKISTSSVISTSSKIAKKFATKIREEIPLIDELARKIDEIAGKIPPI